MPQTATETSSANMADPGLRRCYLEAIMGLHFASGNRVRLLRNGREIFPAMLRAIREAQISIEFLTYIYWRGDIAAEFAKALAERARAGVRVRVLLDSLGCAPMPPKLRTLLQDAGVDVGWFRPVRLLKLHQVDNRTHRKVLVCDNRVGFTGGVGIASEWEGDARNPQEWRETHLQLEGPCVAGLTGAFWDDWFQVRGYTDMPDERLVDATYARPGSTLVQIVRSSAMRQGSENAALLSALIKLARKRLDIVTAYFVPNELFADKLCDKVRQGVPVRVILPGDHTDHRFDQLAGEDIFQDLLDCGVRLFRYQRTMLHAKIILCDDDLALVGSTNFNHRSISKDDEVSAVISDKAIVRQLDDDLSHDLADCEEIKSWKWKRRGILQRTGETLTKPFKKQL